MKNRTKKKIRRKSKEADASVTACPGACASARSRIRPFGSGRLSLFFLKNQRLHVLFSPSKSKPKQSFSASVNFTGQSLKKTIASEFLFVNGYPFAVCTHRFHISRASFGVSCFAEPNRTASALYRHFRQSLEDIGLIARAGGFYRF